RKKSRAEAGLQKGSNSGEARPRDGGVGRLGRESVRAALGGRRGPIQAAPRVKVPVHTIRTIMKIDKEPGLDAVAAHDRPVIRALIKTCDRDRRLPMEGRSGGNRRSRRRGLQGSRG